MADLTAVRFGLAKNLRSIPGCQVSEYPMANPTPPCIQILGPTVDYDLAMGRGLDEWTFTVQVMVALPVDGAQRNLDRFVASSGESSVKAAIEQRDSADGMYVTLGGLVNDVDVRRARADQLATLATSNTPVAVGEWEVVVLVEGA